MPPLPVDVNVPRIKKVDEADKFETPRFETPRGDKKTPIGGNATPTGKETPRGNDDDHVVNEGGIEMPRDFFKAGATDLSWTGEFTYENKDTYSGALISVAGKMIRQGYGTYTHKRIDKTVEVYEGEFQGDRREGFGVYTYANGDTEQGQWVGGVPHGI